MLGGTPARRRLPFFQRIDLAALGATLRTPRSLRPPLDGGRAAYVALVEETAGGLGADGPSYQRLLGPLVRDVTLTLPEILAPMMRSVPGHPVALARFGLDGVLPASLLARRFHTEEARGLLAGVAAHAMLPLTALATGGFGLTLMMIAHAVGWPVVEGGSARLIDALVAELTSLGGQVETGRWVRSLDDLPPARAVLLDVTPGSSQPSRADRSRAGGAVRWPVSATGRESARSTGHCRARCRGRPPPAGRRGRCPWAARSPRWRGERRT